MKTLFDMTKYLFDSGANETTHTGRTLYDHLMGTYLILKSWEDCPEHVAVAGMFHSIYGTVYFKTQTTDNREEIKDLIGEEAETLVRAFCDAQHPRREDLLRIAKEREISCDELYWIDCANEIDSGEKAYDMTGIEHMFPPAAIEQNEKFTQTIEDAEQGTFSSFSDG
jgi:hypothetical protein